MEFGLISDMRRVGRRQVDNWVRWRAYTAVGRYITSYSARICTHSVSSFSLTELSGNFCSSSKDGPHYEAINGGMKSEKDI